MLQRLKYLNDRILLHLISLTILVSPYRSKLLPFALSLLTLSIIIFIISNYKKISWYDFKRRKIYLLPIFTLFCLTSVIISQNQFASFKILERYVSFIILPLIFFIIIGFKNISITDVIKVFGLAVIISQFVFLIQLYNNVNIANIITSAPDGMLIKYFRYYITSSEMSFHPSYYSYFLLIYLILLFNIKRFKVKGKWLFITHGGICLIFILFLSSRSAYITLFAIIIYKIFHYTFKRNFYYSIGLLIFLSGLFFVSLQFTRFGQSLIDLRSSKEISNDNNRILIWQNALTLIKQKPVLGYGIGDALDEMIKEHEKTGFKDGVEKRLDAHNQFLEVWLQSGLPGLISLILVFAFPLYQSIKKRQELLFLFLLISFIQFLFESMFIRLAGVVYFAFFYSYLYYYYYAPGGEWEKAKSLTIS